MCFAPNQRGVAMYRLVLAISAVFFFFAPPRIGAQTAARDENAPSAPVQPGGTSKDRLFFTLPNFLTLENAPHVPPLTAREKFKVTLQSSFDPGDMLWYASTAGLNQAQNSESGYGQGSKGYAKRFGANFADGTTENLMTEAIFPSLLHQDPRYFQLGKGGLWRRTRYAISRIFLTRSDAGGTQFNYSEIMGSATAAGISTFSYHPHADRHFSNALNLWGSELGFDAFTYLAREFWPDIRRKLRKSK